MPITFNVELPIDINLLKKFWDFLDKQCIANRTEYTESEQADIFLEFIATVTR